MVDTEEGISCVDCRVNTRHGYTLSHNGTIFEG